MTLTLCRTDGTIMPSVNSPNNGPPTTPNTVSDACNKLPRYWTANATPMHTKPYTSASSFDGSAEPLSFSGRFSHHHHSGFR